MAPDSSERKSQSVNCSPANHNEGLTTRIEDGQLVVAVGEVEGDEEAKGDCEDTAAH